MESPFRPQVFGQYLLVDLLGRGGMAEVFLAAPIKPTAEPPELVALKRLLPKYSLNPTFVQRLIDEAKVTALLVHPNIVQVKELGGIGTDFFMTMEWVHGVSYDQILECSRERGEPLPKEAAMYVALQVATALEGAHTAKDKMGRQLDVVHCDVSPHNTLVNDKGEVKLADFGIARVEHLQTTSPTDVAVGKLAYMSPEQLARQSLDHRSDIYSLGVLLYEGLAGHRPFEGRSVVELQQQIMQDPPPLDDPIFANHPALRDVISSCLSKDRELRPMSAGEILHPLQGFNLRAGKKALVRALTQGFEEEQNRIQAAIADLPNRIGEAQQAIQSETEALEKRRESSPPPQKTEWIPKESEPNVTQIVFKAAPDEPSESSEKLARIGIKKKKVARVVERRPIIEEDLTTPPDGYELPPESFTPAPESSPSLVEEESLPEVADPPEPTPPPVVEERKLPTPPPFESEPLPSKASIRKPTPAPSIPHPPPSRWTDSRTLQIGLSGLALLVAILVLFEGVRRLVPALFAPSSEQEIVQTGPLNEIQFFATAEKVATDEDELAWRELLKSHPRWLASLRDFFSREFRTVTGERSIPLNFTWKREQRSVDRVRWEGTLFSPYRAFDDFATLFGISQKPLEAGVGRIYLHLYVKKPEEAASYPVDFVEKRPLQTGIVFVPIQEWNSTPAMVRVAHEVLHVMGAEDKYDEEGLPIFPQGYANPFRDPLYPQQVGEIMSRSIPQSATDYRLTKSLREVRIGLTTAAEIGWVNEAQAQKYYQPLSSK